MIALANLFLFTGFQMFPSALPLYIQSLGVSDHVVGTLTGAATVASLLMRPLAGIILDRYGRKWIFITGLVIMWLATMSYEFVTIIWVILLIRFFQGLGSGISGTASNTIATDNVPKARFAEGMAYFSLSMSVALAVAPGVALYLGMRKTVIVAAVLMFIAIMLALFGVQYKTADRGKAKRHIGFPYEKLAAWPAAIMFLLAMTYGTIVTFIAIYAKSRGIAKIGVFFTFYAAALLITRPFFGKLIDRKGFNYAFFPGLVLICAAMLFLAQATALYEFLLSAVCFGTGYGACQTSLQTLAVLKSPQNHLGAANATFYTGFDLGMGLGAITAGMLAQIFGYSNMFLSAAILPVIAGILFFLTLRKTSIASLKAASDHN